MSREAATYPFRRAGPDDAPAVEALTRAAYAKWVSIVGRKPLPMTADYARAVREHRIELIEIEGELAGLIELAPAPDHLLIVNLAVAPDRQGQGLGATLLGRAETVARGSGQRELRLYTNGLMTQNIALYRRHGYAVSRIEERGPGWSVVHMLKTLGEA